MVMSLKLRNSGISMKKVIIATMLYIFDQKNGVFLRGHLGLSSIT